MVFQDREPDRDVLFVDKRSEGPEYAKRLFRTADETDFKRGAS